MTTRRRHDDQHTRPLATSLMAATMAVLIAGPVLADGTADTESVKPKAPPTRDVAKAAADEHRRAAVDDTNDLVPYVPKSRGKAKHSAAGGTRTASRLGNLEVAVIAPDEGLTTRAQPVLYWFVSETTNARVDVTLTDDDAIDPLIEVTLPTPVTAGIHAIDLAEYDVSLEAGRSYRWSVAVVQDADRRSTDKTAEAMIERTGASASLERSLADASRRYAPYALSGIWYDAIDELRSARAADPQDRGLRRQEIALLEQIDLTGVARFARTAAR